MITKLPNITQYAFPANQYLAEEHPKAQIYLHHTAGGPSAINTFKGWESNSERIATCIAIDNSGEIVQGFSSKYWAFHLGLKESTFQKYGVPYKSLDRISIGIEICNWGQLTKKGDKFYNYVKKEVPVDQVWELPVPYKGYTYFHSYTDAQIQSVKNIVVYLGEKYDIPLTYNHDDLWNISPKALRGEKGIYTHNSVRTDKVDIYPHPKMIEMLEQLK